MVTSDLIPLGQAGNEEHDRLVRSKLKGSFSIKRKIAQSLSHPARGLSEEQVKFRALLKDGKIAELILELVSLNLGDVYDARRRDIIISQLTSLIKSNNVNVLNVQNNNSDWNRWVEELKERKKVWLQYHGIENIPEKEITEVDLVCSRIIDAKRREQEKKHKELNKNDENTCTSE